MGIKDDFWFADYLSDSDKNSSPDLSDAHDKSHAKDFDDEKDSIDSQELEAWDPR